MMIRTSLAVFVAAAMGLALVSCSDGDDDATAPAGEEEAQQSDGGNDNPSSDDPERQAYIDAFVTSSSDDELTEEENQCFGAAIVDSVGVEKLSAVATPDEVSQAAGSVPSDLGVEVTQEEGEAFYDSVSECVDIEELFAQGIAGDDSVPQEAKDCLVDAFDGDFLRDFYVSLYIQGSESFAEDSELMSQMETAYTECGLTP
jgi:hypothetical protein